ncbi:hypothetical protein DS901_03490 [Loktanella sp. D2R18]|uniref:hypothetical protein n=1 Tax=Rhodobacterales TaxID=204455 RepID=UPI000DE82875|nr:MULTISPECIES: hypothetical protein [Rhodobacterales]MDO6589279.1 hypothetical protein [Yoonia sp. 1_MG-2023]RBW45299.1 hypothetical protein DS901_03490 [Loktanella sp. D2R18]
MPPPLSEQDYSAIGKAVTAFSQLENLLAQINALCDVGNDTTVLNEHQTIFVCHVKKSFRQRVNALVVNLGQNPNRKLDIDTVETSLNTIVKWRDCICHGVFTKHSGGQLELVFWDRKSFDEAKEDEKGDIRSGPIQKLLKTADLIAVAKEAQRLKEILANEFSMEKFLS